MTVSLHFGGLTLWGPQGSYAQSRVLAGQMSLTRSMQSADFLTPFAYQVAIVQPSTPSVTFTTVFTIIYIYITRASFQSSGVLLL